MFLDQTSFDPNFFGPKVFFQTQIFYRPKLMDQEHHWTQKKFQAQNLMDPNFSDPKFIFTLKDFLGPKIFFRPKFFLDPNFFCTNIFFQSFKKIVFGLKISLGPKTWN